MHEAALHSLIGKALTEPRFRAELLARPKKAIRGLPLSRMEKALIGSVEAPSLEEFAKQIKDQLEMLQN